MLVLKILSSSLSKVLRKISSKENLEHIKDNQRFITNGKREITPSYWWRTKADVKKVISKKWINLKLNWKDNLLIKSLMASRHLTKSRKLRNFGAIINKNDSQTY